ncbi:DUF1491 family protein [Polycladidibacter stylochi]|uniref:DUF1491 family protein n=1 Tax=Polycladidibacter stylochi TaxID=1807766 RepID=UPI000836B541|nr:DUF1491 family protein [Pseudovibrio stylochi]
MRLTSKFWTTAYIRRCFSEGAYALINQKGAEEAGSIFVIVDHINGSYDLYGPAPQSYYCETKEQDREFERLKQQVTREDILDRLQKEKRMDADFWVIEVEDKEGRHFLNLSKGENEHSNPLL